jgi:protein-disulfide isomerase
MNPFKNIPIVYAIAALLFTLIAVAATAQNRVEGSRPGETYRIGEAAPAQEQPVQQYAPQQQVPSQYPTGYQAPGQAGTPLPVQGQSPAAAAVSSAATSNQRAVPAGTPLIMEFSDLQCPDSARFNETLKGNIMQRFVGNGKAEYQWHDFPLPSHEQADEAAAAARCAGASADQMRKLIMGNQGQMTPNMFAQYARQLGVDPQKFDACMRSGATAQQVQQDKALGQSMGVRGTPTLVLGMADGRGGVQPVKVVKAYDPPEQVIGEIDSFMQQAASAPAPRSAQ